MFTYGAGFALLISFVALRLLWPSARLQGAAVGRAVPQRLDGAVAAFGIPLRLLGLAGFAITLWAAWFGADNVSSNIAPVAVYVVFWVGLPLASAFLGDVWRVLSPFEALGVGGQWINRQREKQERVSTTPPRWATGHWLAASVLLAFQWLELAYHTPASTRVLAVALSAYSVAVLAGAARWGRDWLRNGEGFGVLFNLIAHLAPFYRDDDGTLRVRLPLTGLASLQPGAGTGVLLVVLGGTTFDGVTRTSFWDDVVGGASGWTLTAYNTAGLVWAIGLVAVVYVAATRFAARLTDRPLEALTLTFVHSLVPIVLAYTIAHYFSLLVFEGQGALARASDPFGEGWDLFGTATWTIDFRAVSVATIAFVPAGAILVGHVAGVVVAHDRAVGLLPFREAVRSQYPVLAAMVLYTVAGLTLLLGA